MNILKNILVATDFSTDSRTALDEAVALAEKFKATVYVLHAVNAIKECAVDYCLSEEQVAGGKNRLLGEAKKMLDNEIRRYSGRTGATLIPDLRYGQTYDEILNEESRKDIDLLVIAPHAKKTFWPRISAHLSEKLARNSTCDTLLVRRSA